MKIPADIHTHHPSQTPGEVIVNCYPDTFLPEAEQWYSVDIHPWYIPKTAAPALHGGQSAIQEEEELLSSLAVHPQVLAVGEAGLDKLTDTPLAAQIEVFQYQARLAMEIDKPLIIHLVKAVDELLRQKQLIRPPIPGLFTAFAGRSLWRKNTCGMAFTSRSERSSRKKRSERFLPTGCFWRQTKVLPPSENSISRPPPSAGLLRKSFGKRCGKTSAKSFLNDKSWLLE